MVRTHRMTPEMTKSVIQSMTRIFAHPITKIFLSLRRTRDIHSADHLPQVYEMPLIAAVEIQTGIDCRRTRQR